MASQHRLRMSGDVRDLIRNLHPNIKQKVRAALSEIIENQLCGKPLREDLEGLRSFRVGKLRIIYRPVSGVIEIIAIGPRHSIYEETLRFLQTKK